MREGGATRYPLTWPAGWPRTPTSERKRAAFKDGKRGYRGGDTTVWHSAGRLTVYSALRRLATELRRLGAGEEVLSTNLRTRLDGMPRSDQREPEDPGAAVYFAFRGKPLTLACDRWTRVADNIAAIAAHIEAVRAVDRYGVGSLDQAFAGYTALPAHAVAASWWDELGVPSTATLAEVEDAYKKLAWDLHPDRGGDHDRMARVNAARDAARAAVGA